MGFVFLILGYFTSQKAGLFVESNPNSSVYVNSEQVGRTPFEGTFPVGEVTIKLVPEAFDKPLSPFETKVNLTAGVKTVVRRTFGETNHDSSGEIISYEKTGEKEASLAIVSTPDSANIKLDGESVGFTPIKLASVNPGEHEVSIEAEGFIERSFSVVIREGYRLIVVVDLAEQPAEEIDKVPESQRPEDKDIIKQVEILPTPVGFLRVREEPNTSSKEVGRVKPGEKYKLIETNPEKTWYKIEYEEAKNGWILGEYAKVVTP